VSWWGRRLAWMNRELFFRSLRKRRIYLLWKKGWETWEEHEEFVRMCRKKIRKGKSPA